MGFCKRQAGVLLHITSLPSAYGVGTLGKAAFDFVDWLYSANLHLWQVLPLVPTNYGDSPYQSVSSTALNYYLIDLDILREKGLLQKKEYQNIPFAKKDNRVDYHLLFINKVPVLRKAFLRFDATDQAFLDFVASKKYHDFAVFMTLKAMHDYQAWECWQEPYRNYSLKTEEEVVSLHREDYLFWLWTQFEFLNQWNALHQYAKTKQIEIMGDMPLYVAYDSVEVWKHPELFVLSADHRKKLVAGCPPDAFTEDGQLWGNPIYDWDYMKKDRYAWWQDRLSRAFELFDILRIDHFRGFDRFYAIPAEDTTARNGRWLDGPKFDFFKDKTELKIVAEDLGFIDVGVRELMRKTTYPGMKILQFALDGSKENEHLPSNYGTNFVVYTGTHDNLPLYQFIFDLSPSALKIFLEQLKEECRLAGVRPRLYSYRMITQTVVELAFASKADYCIIPMQDLLAQDGTSRMNFPSTVSVNNWSYRVLKRQLSRRLADRIRRYVEKYRRD